MANSDKNIRITPNRGTTSFPKIVFTGQSNDPITVNVLDDNSLSFSGSAGQLFSLSNNISTGTIFSVNDISGFPAFRINANGNVSSNEFSGNFGIGISNPFYKFQVIGNVGISGGVALTAGLATTSSSSGTLVVTGGASVGSSLSIGGSLLLWNGANYTAFRYTGTATTIYTLPASSPAIGTSVLQSDTSGILSWVPMTATGSAGGAGTVNNSAANLIAFYPSAGTAVTGNTSLSASGTGLTIGFTTVSTGTTTGALTVAGGVGIGGSLNVASSSQIASVIISGNTITGNLTGTATTATYANQAGYGITSGSANSWTTPRTLNLSGDLSGSVIWSGSGDTTLSATIVANSVALGTDTTGQYASTIAISGSGITATAANADDGTTYTIYSSATSNNTASSLVFRDGSGNFSAGTISANLSGTATTATYSHQAGYAITSGSSALATTATYSHQSGYGITAGSASIATTATYSHQAGYAITSGSSATATTATYSHQAGYAITSGSSGTATSATYANQAGYAITAGSANAWTTPRTLNLSGDLSGSVVWSGSGDTTITATINANSVALGTDTTGQYASTITISGSGITATASNADDATGYTIYSSATASNISSSIVLRDGSGNFSAGTITGSLSGTASTATYANQAGYGLTAGSSATATTATYSHQSGYAITSGSSSSSAIATTASNLNVGTASNNIFNPILFSPQGTGSGVAVSSLTSLSFNPTANILNVSGVAITASTASTSTSTGALIVSGGVGIGGSVNIGGRVGIGTNLLNAALNLTTPSASVSGIVIQGSTSQSASLFRVNSSTGGSFFEITNTGILNIKTSTVGDWNTIPLQRWYDDSNNITGVFQKGGFLYTGAGLGYVDGTGTQTLVHQWVPASSYYITNWSKRMANGGQIMFASSAGGDVRIYGDTNGSLTFQSYGTYTNNTMVKLMDPNPGTNQALLGVVTPGGGNTRSQLFSYGNLALNMTVAGSAGTDWDTTNLFNANVVTKTKYTGNLAVLSVDSTNRFVVGPYGNTTVALGGTTVSTGFIIKAATSQTGNLFEAQSSTGATITFIDASGNLSIGASTASTSSATGALIVSGGVGIGGSLYVASAIVVNSGANGLLFQRAVGASLGAIYSTNVTPSTSNYSFATDGNNLNLNSQSNIYLNISNTVKATLSTNNFAVNINVASTSPSTGSFTVSGGVGIGGSLFTGTSFPNSISGVVLSNGFVTSGTWAGSTITAFYGGTGLQAGSFVTGSLLAAGSSTTWLSLTPGINGYFLVSNGASALPSYQNPEVLTVGLATTATYSHQSGYAITSGSASVATTATYAHQSGFAITSGSSALATTAAYSHQAGYAITSGSSALATTSTYAHQAGYAITAGSSALATTATYSHQSGYGITAGSSALATTATYSHQSGYAITSGNSSFATTASNINVASGTAGTLYFIGTGISSGSGLAVSSVFPVYYNFSPSQLTAPYFYSSNSSGDEGGEIVLNKSATNTTLNTSITIDINQNRLRFFETGGTNRGFYLDISTGGVSAGTNIMGGSSSGTVNSGVQNQVAYYAANGNAVSGTSSLQVTGTGVTVGFTTLSTSSSTGALTVAGGAGIAGSVYIAGEVRVGTNTFTKNYSGDINLDNGTADTPGIRYYWQNNRNFGNDVYYSGSGSTRWRVVKEMGEVGGAELFSVDREGVVYINNPGSGVVSLKHTGSGSATYTFPNTAPATGTSVLQSDTTGVLSWVPMTAGGGSGSVNNSAANLVAFYPSAGTAVTGNTSVSISGTGLSIGFNTNSTSSSTGALTVAGGAGIAGTLWANVIGIGLTLSYIAPNLLASFASSVNSYNQVIIQNRSNGTSASADFVLNNDSSTDTTFFGNLGMNSSGFTGSGSFNLANAVYLSSTTGDLVIGSTTANLIRFVYSSGTTDTMQISGTGVSILPTTNSTSVNTGALIVSGSVGIAGSIFIGNQITQTFNPTTGAGSDHAYFIQSSPLRTSIGSLIQIGTAALWDGATAGFFTGSANGTYIGINAATGTTASAIDFQIAGATRFQVGSGGSTIINNYTEIKAPDTTNKALRVLGFSSATQGDILSFEHPAGGSFNMNGNLAGQAGGRFTIIASGNSQVRAATFAIQASDTKTVLNVDATSGAGALSLQNATNLQLFNSTNAQYAGFRYTGTSTTTYTLPASAPGAGTSVLQSDTAGNMSWVAMASGGGGSGTVTTLTAGTGVTFSTGTTITTTGTIRSKRHVNLTFCSGFTPVASGADTVVLRVPDSPSDGTSSLTYKPQEFFIRVETASATASTVQLEKYTGTGAFSGTAITSIGISGAATFERSGTVFAAAGSLLTSGDKLRINFTALSASHANFSVYLLLEEV